MTQPAIPLFQRIYKATATFARATKNDSDIYNRQFSDIVPEKDATKRQGYPPWKASQSAGSATLSTPHCT